MTPKEKLSGTPETGPILSWEADLFSLPPDDAPYELPPGDPQAAIALLRQWREDESDAQEQCETFACLNQTRLI